MSPTAYFHVESLRRRFVLHLHAAIAQGSLDALESRWLQRLCSPQGPVPQTADAPAVYSLLLEDGSPVSLGLATALLIVRRHDDAETLYLDTLAHGLETFTDRTQLARHLQRLFGVRADREPVFEYQALNTDPFEQRMLRIVEHQAQGLSTLDRELEQLPQLHDLPASVDPRYELDRRLEDFWNSHDLQGLSRRIRLAQSMADALAHRAWQWEHAGHPEGGALALLATQWLDTPAPASISRLAVSVAGQGPFKLIGLYGLSLGNQGYVLYCPATGLRRLDDWHALVAHFDSEGGRAQWQGCLSLDDQALLPATGTPVVQHYPLAEPLFMDCIDSIIALQRRNLDEAFKRHRSDPGERQAMLDDALDVRRLLDGRLPFVEGSRRWASPAPFASTWPLLAPPAPVHAPPPLHESMPDWLAQLSRLDRQLTALNARRPRLDSLASQALSPWLAVLGDPAPLNAALIEVDWVQTNGDSQEDHPIGALPAVPVVTQARSSLIDLLLEHMSGARTTPLPAGSTVFVRQPGRDNRQPLAATSHRLFAHVLNRAASRLGELCAGSVEAFDRHALRQAHAQTLPGQTLCASRQALLRLELAVARRDKTFPALLADPLQSVLDQPVASQHPVLASGPIQISALVLHADDRPLALPMSQAWVFGQPGQALLFWSTITGLQPMASVQDLGHWLNRCLMPAARRDRWLALFAEQDQPLLDQFFAAGRSCSVEQVPVGGHFFERMQRDEQQRQQQRIDNALEQVHVNRLTAPLCKRYIDLAGQQSSLQVWLDNLAIRIQNRALLAMLPDWLSQASVDELEVYVDLLNHYDRDFGQGADFLSGIPSLHAFALKHLQAALARDFPGALVDPQRIIVTMTRYIPAPVPMGSLPSAIPAATQIDSESLVAFALNHFAHLQGATLSVSLPADTAQPAGLSADYLSALVHELDLGMRYRTLLATRLDPADPHYVQRRERFIRQVPLLLSLVVLEMKLQGQLSPVAFDFIQCLIEMPDSQARQPVHGCDIVLRPLSLVPRPDMAADPVAGLYLIGPLDTRQGPVVLHALFNASFCLKEFRDQDDLLAQLRADGPLQQLVLDRVAPMARRRYAHGGLDEAHIPWSTEAFMDLPLQVPAKVALSKEVLEGNVLLHMFQVTLQLLKDLSGKQSVTSAEADWASFVHVLALGAEQILAFIPGKLGMLLAAWQSQALFRASASAAYEQRWGKALSEFSAALGVLVTTYRQATDPALPEPGEAPVVSVPELPEFSWRHSVLTPRLKQRLRPFEVHDIELARLHHDVLLNLYQDPSTSRYYAAVTGQVYEVALHEHGWRIVGRTGEGPAIRLDSHRQWELNLMQGLRGGGLPDRASEREAVQDTLDKLMVVQCNGMTEIRGRRRDQALHIGQARQQALDYLRTALFNLNAPFAKGLPVPVQGVLKDFFGVDVPGMMLIDSLRSRVSELFLALSQRTLSPLDSRRFVTGTPRRGRESVAAFVIIGDPQDRIFLGPLFFSPPLYPIVPGIRAFNAGNHFRAIVLLHELSHLVVGTHDIAYLDASAPPLELLDASQPVMSRFKQHLQYVHRHALSHLTPPAQLFQSREDNTLRDFDAQDGEVYASLLTLSGQADLQAARRAFLEDSHARRRIILANADSLALLISLLGRQRWR